MYNFNLLIPLYLISLSLDEKGSLDKKKNAKLVKLIDKKVRLQIEKKN